MAPVAPVLALVAPVAPVVALVLLATVEPLLLLLLLPPQPTAAIEAANTRVRVIQRGADMSRSEREKIGGSRGR
ncbi:MAG TPA: hypothetical protein DEA08_16805 [Planctomycetes bacterium]|nr:hypothetical protein [Planctomycetota bacterium]